MEILLFRITVFVLYISGHDNYRKVNGSMKSLERGSSHRGGLVFKVKSFVATHWILWCIKNDNICFNILSELDLEIPAVLKYPKKLYWCAAWTFFLHITPPYDCYRNYNTVNQITFSQITVIPRAQLSWCDRGSMAPLQFSTDIYQLFLIWTIHYIDVIIICYVTSFFYKNLTVIKKIFLSFVTPDSVVGSQATRSLARKFKSVNIC